MRNLVKITLAATILLALVFFGVHPPALSAESAATAPVQKWEYAELEIIRSGDGRDEIKTEVIAFGPGGKRSDLTERQAAARFNAPNCLPIELMNGMGDEGWEFISIKKENVTQLATSWEMFFKRKK